MSNNEDENERVDERMNRSIKKYLTTPIRGYVSEIGRDAIHRLQQVGFDPDLAFEIAASSIPEDEFYDLDLGKEKEGEDE